MDNLNFSRLFLPKVTFYHSLILILIIFICILKPILIPPALIIYIVILAFSISESKIRNKEILKYIETLNFDIDSVTKDTLLSFPLPLLVAEPTGEIIWYNSLFASIIEKNQSSEVIKESLQGLFSSGDEEPKSNIYTAITIGENSYLVFGNNVNIEKKEGKPRYLSMLYFLDQTENVLLKKKFEETRPVVGLVAIDNYEELMQNSEDSAKPQILAEIDKKVSAWFAATGGIIKKFERDKYLCIFEDVHLEGFEEKKFDIIDIIKDINAGNKIPVTLSIGIGKSAEILVENHLAAVAALDVALGRGGDQVVVKDGEKYTFFGGRTKEIERRTRVKARVVAHALNELMNQSEQLIIMGHINPDIDSLGSAIGLYRVAESKGKKAYIVLNNSNIMIDSLMEKFSKEKEYEGVFINRNEALDKINKKTLLIVVDTHKPGLTECPELLKFTEKIVVIDHHRRGTDFINDPVLAFHEIYASSTCELVTEITQYLDGEKILKPIEAEALYAGITIDTKNFTFKTGIRTFEAAAFLKKFGVETMVVKQLFQNDLDTYTARAEVVKNAEMVNDIAISVCPENIKNPALIAAQAADELLGITGITASFVLCKFNDVVSISGRSLGDINVQVILEKMGGGGHLTVAGSQLADVSIDEAKEMLKNYIFEYIDETNSEQKKSVTSDQ